MAFDLRECLIFLDLSFAERFARGERGSRRGDLDLRFIGVENFGGGGLPAVIVKELIHF
jgi:hypothetical protein